MNYQNNNAAAGVDIEAGNSEAVADIALAYQTDVKVAEQSFWEETTYAEIIPALGQHPSPKDRDQWHEAVANVSALRAGAEERGHLAVAVQLATMYLGFRMVGDADDERIAGFKDLVTARGLTPTTSKWAAANAVIFYLGLNLKVDDQEAKKKIRNEIERNSAAIMGLDVLVREKVAEGFSVNYNFETVKQLTSLVREHGITKLGEKARTDSANIQQKGNSDLIALDPNGVRLAVKNLVTQPYGNSLPSVGLVVIQNGQKQVVGDLGLTTDRIIDLLAETAKPEPRVQFLSEMSRLAQAITVYKTNIPVKYNDDPEDPETAFRSSAHAWWLRQNGDLLVTQFSRPAGHVVVQGTPNAELLPDSVTEDLWLRTRELSKVIANIADPSRALVFSSSIVDAKGENLAQTRFRISVSTEAAKEGACGTIKVPLLAARKQGMEFRPNELDLSVFSPAGQGALPCASLDGLVKVANSKLRHVKNLKDVFVTIEKGEISVKGGNVKVTQPVIVKSGPASLAFNVHADDWFAVSSALVSITPINGLFEFQIDPDGLLIIDFDTPVAKYRVAVPLLRGSERSNRHLRTFTPVRHDAAEDGNI